MKTDARVLDEEYVPLDVPHRNAELNHLSTALEPIERGQSGETTLLLGPSGTGKTCLAKHMLRQLREQVPDMKPTTSTAGRTTPATVC
jgi:Cdc6-like AAA superfamily ATPase